MRNFFMPTDGAQRVPRSTWWLLGIWLLIVVWVGRYQWDFPVHYNAALLLRAGLNPYSGEALAYYPGTHLIGFVYLPLALLLPLPFTLLTYPAAATAWFGVKLLGAGLLARLWTQHFWKFNLLTRPAALLILCFGLNATLIWDFASGNPALLEQALLWLALATLLSGHDKRFGVLIAMAALFKVLPAFFLMLPVLAFPRPRWRAFAWGVACTAFLFALNPLLFPQEFQNFRATTLGAATTGSNWWQRALDANLFQYEREAGGAANTSALFFWRAALPAVGGWVAEKAGMGAWPANAATYSDELTYLAGAAAIAAISLFHLMRYRQRTAAFEPRLIILFLCLVFALLVPRLKPYSLVIAIAPVVFIYYRRRDAAQLMLLLGLALIPHYSESALPLPIARLARIAVDFLPLLTVFVAWLLFLAEMRTEPRASASSAESSELVTAE
jgi:hypothetical protein